MKNSSKFKLSSELAEFFRRAHDEVLTFHGKEVTLDHILAQIVIDYLDGDGDIPELCNYLNNLFPSSESENGFRETVINIISDLRATNKFTAPDSLYTGNDHLALSPAIEFILRKIDTLNGGMVKETDSMAFLMCSLPESKYSKIVKHLLNYGASTRDLTKLYWNINNFDDKLDQLEKKLKNNGIDPGELKEKVIDYSGETPDDQPEIDPEKRKEEDDREFEMAGQGSSEPENLDPNSKTPFLDKFSTDMTLAAKNGEYDPIVGRDKEISQIIEILSCRKKKNGILLAEAGVGKTAIIEGLCQKIVNKEVPRELIDKRILSLDLNALVAGCQFRGCDYRMAV